MFDNNSQDGCLTFITKLFVEEAQYAQITKLEALSACSSVLTKLQLETDLKLHLFDTFLNTKLLVPLSRNVYLVNDNASQGVLVNFSSCYSPLCKKGTISCYSPSCPNRKKHITSDNVSTVSVLGEREQQRQVAIEAFLSNERLYLSQLTKIRDSFSVPLQHAIEESRRSSFHDTLFGNYQAIAALHEKIIQDLESSRTNGYFPSSLSNVLLEDLSQIHDPYLRYASNHAFSTYYYALEYNRNYDFARLVDQQQHDTSLIDLLLLPITHIPTCLSLITTIAEHDSSFDRCIEFMTHLLHSMQEATRTATAEQRLLEIRQSQPSVPDDMIYEGPADLIATTTTTTTTTTVRCHLMLFTHAFWITRESTNAHGETEYVLIDQPIPLPMLRVAQKPMDAIDSDDASVSTTYTLSGLRIRHRIRRMKQRINNNNNNSSKRTQTLVSTAVVERKKSPRTDPRYLQIGHLADPLIAYTFSCVNRSEWLKKIKSILPDPEDGPFFLTLQQSTFNESILCSLPTSDGQLLLSTKTGIWMGDKQLFHQPCHQLAFFDTRTLLVRMTNRVLAVVEDNESVHILQRSVLHFATGTFRDEPILCYLRRRRTSGSVQLVLMDSRLKKRKRYKPQLMQPTEVIIANDCIYLRSLTEGVERISIASWMMGSVGKRLPCPAATTVAYVPLDDHVALLCSPTYAHPAAELEDADTVQQGIAFDSKAKKVVVWYPYLIVFSMCVIEIRHLETTELVQVIPGHRIKCLYVNLPVVHASMVIGGQTKLFQLVLNEMVLCEDETQSI